MILPIVTDPNPILHGVAEPIAEVTPEIRQLVDDMRDTMRNAEGIGLAAPQVGKLLALCVIEQRADDEDQGIPFIALLNPRITWHSTQRDRMVEGCLSLPGIEATISRPVRVRVKAKDLDGNELTIETGGLFARALQHEIDHLNGVLFTSYVAKKRDLMPRETPDYPRV